MQSVSEESVEREKLLLVELLLFYAKAFVGHRKLPVLILGSIIGKLQFQMFIKFNVKILMPHACISDLLCEMPLP